MYWKIPPKIKIYEALGCLADGRLKKVDGKVQVYSSSGQKFYTVTFDEKKKAIMTNDNGSYWIGYWGLFPTPDFCHFFQISPTTCFVNP